jgi:hypothetical protein
MTIDVLREGAVALVVDEAVALTAALRAKGLPEASATIELGADGARVRVQTGPGSDAPALLRWRSGPRMSWDWYEAPTLGAALEKARAAIAGIERQPTDADLAPWFAEEPARGEAA